MVQRLGNAYSILLFLYFTFCFLLFSHHKLYPFIIFFITRLASAF